MKIAFITSGFYSGGFTTGLLNMIHLLSKEKIKCDIFLYNEVDNINVDLPQGSNLFFLKKTSSYFNYIFLVALYLDVRYLKYKFSNDKMSLKQLSLQKYIKYNMSRLDLREYDCVISWEELQCNYFLANKVTSRKKIGYVHPDYRKAGFNPRLDKKSFNQLDHIICVSKATTNTLIQTFPTFKDKVIYQRNVLNVSEIRKLAQDEPDIKLADSFNLVTVCRLDNRSKALDRAVNITNSLNKKGYLFNWYVVGEGASKKELENQINQLNVKNFHLIGLKSNPYPYIKRADLFVLQSYYEGMPIAVDEAIILNTPVLVTNYASAKEQVISESLGFIVENDEKAIENALEEILLKKAEFSTRGSKEVIDYTDISYLIKCILN